MTVSAKQGQHLTTSQKSRIRHRYFGLSDTALARKYGVTVRTIRLVRDTAEDDHAARMSRFRGFPGGGGGARVRRSVVPPTEVRQPKGQLQAESVEAFTTVIEMRTADGHQIPQTMR